MELDMPQPLHFVELKKDGYDENGANKYNKEKDGDNYKEKQVVTELQKNLVTLGFLADSKDATDGYFGDTTDTAVREFQDYAIKTDRMKRSKGKIEQADKALDQSGPDGIVGKKTADEIDLWLRKDWVKPEITLRHGEYDDTGVQNGKGNKGTDDHHKGTPVVKAQENLQNVGVYKEYNVDGWFHDKMQDAVKRFQEAAEKGEFLINNVLTDIGEKLAGHRKGSYCPKTRAYLQKVVKKNGVVPAGKVIKKGAKGDIVVEINIRLSGFGGGVPSDVFDEFTEVKVKQFQKDYMKIKTPSGEVDEETASKIDEFGQKFTVDFDRLKCLCGKCGGFGKGRHKNDFFEKKDKYGNPKQHTEATHRYEYPGMHRSLLWAVRGLEFHLDKETLFSAKIDKFSSGYRCNDHILTIQRQTVNHMGKAVDIHFSTKIGQTWITSKNDKDNNDLCEEIRKICLKSSVLNAQMEWGSLNRFSLESTVDGAKTWVHADVRMFEKKYLEDKFFCKNIQEMNGELFLTLFKGKE
jgi:peptidoglycan hydrolase-like protein with peptidoglycan-binding domain